MITVRFPNGHCVQYNRATFLSHDEHGTRIFTKEGGTQIARVQHSAGAIIEFQLPCRVYDALDQDRLAEISKEIRSLKRKVTKK